jgi:hypothetical protein
VVLVDSRTGTVLCPIFPLDKAANADRLRRRLDPEPVWTAEPPQQASDGIAPLLRRLMAQYAATGLPPAYLPKSEEGQA